MTKEIKKVYSISPMGQAINEIIDGKYSSGELMVRVNEIEEQRKKENKNNEPKDLSEVLKDLKPRF